MNNYKMRQTERKDEIVTIIRNDFNCVKITTFKRKCSINTLTEIYPVGAGIKNYKKVTFTSAQATPPQQTQTEINYYGGLADKHLLDCR